MKKITRQAKELLAMMAIAIMPASVTAQSKISIQNNDLFSSSNLQIITDANGSQIGILSKEYVYADAAGIAEQLVYLPGTDGIADFTTAFSLNTNKKYVFNEDGTAVSEIVGDVFDGFYLDADGQVSYTMVDNASDVTFKAYLLTDERNIDAPDSYPLVKIGRQVWMRENLRATKYADGSDITGDLTKEDWGAMESGAYAVYIDENSSEEFNKEKTLKQMGALYNWYAVNAQNGLAPEGYKIPSTADMMTLVNALDPAQFNSNWAEDFSLSFTLGELLKSETGWQVPPSGTEAELQPGSNLSGLNIEPFGSTSTSKWFNGFSGIGRQAYLWTSDAYIDVEDKAMFVRFYWDSQTVNIFYDDMFMGYSVRCFTDNPEIKLDGVHSGIKDACSAGGDVTETARYDASGNLVGSAVKGINIIRYSDGSVRKVII